MFGLVSRLASLVQLWLVLFGVWSLLYDAPSHKGAVSGRWS